MNIKRLCKDRRLHIIIYIFLGMALSANAQTDRTITRNMGAVRFVPGSSLLQTNPSTGMSFQTVGSPFITTPSEDIHPAEVKQPIQNNENNDTIKGQLHGSVGLSVMAGFGKHAPKGAGFAQNFDLNYTVPIGKRGWLTTGGYISHLNWDGINSTNGGLYAELGYNFNENWSAYIYGQKSLVNSGTGYGYYGYPGYYGFYDYGYYGYPGYNPWGDKLGAALRWKPNDNFSLEISVEKDWYPRHDFGYNRRYDYQR